MRARALVALVALGWAATARAAGPLEDQRALPEAPRPPTLPELTHPDGEATLELTTGSLSPRGGDGTATPERGRDQGGSRGHVPIHVGRLAFEQPIGGRHYFVG